MQNVLSTELRYLIYTAILLLVLWIPYIIAELKMTGIGKALSYPDERTLPVWARRLKRAHYNLVENIGPFAVAVLAGEWLGIHTPLTAACAMIFFWARRCAPDHASGANLGNADRHLRSRRWRDVGLSGRNSAGGHHVRLARNRYRPTDPGRGRRWRV